MNLNITDIFNITDTRNINVYDIFYQTYLEDKEKALRWMIYLRDIKDGLGMRVISSILLKLQKDDLHMAMKIAQSDVEQFGRYDDLIKDYIKYNSSIQSILIRKIYEQLHEDMELQKEGKRISLLAKWLPSINTSSDYTRKNANAICNDLLLSKRQYRKILSRLRNHINIIETKLCQKDYNIDYASLPKKALLFYHDAFMRNDKDNYTKYLTQYKKEKNSDNRSFEEKLNNPRYDKIINEWLK